MKVLITDQVDPRCIDILSGEGLEVDYRPGLPADEAATLIGGYEVLVVRSGTQVTAGLIAAAERLKIIGRAGAGVDNIDVDAATRRGIIVMNTPGGNTVSTAEHTLSLILALARNIPQANRSLAEGLWERKKFVGTELSGKTLGVVGLGKVGKEVARRCRAFDMTVIASDPLLTPDAARELDVELAAFEDVLKRSDFITVHTPFSGETRGLIGERELALCKRDVRIINCARGGIVDEAALLAALQAGRVAGAALDVFTEEPPGKNPLIGHPRVVATPHLGASTGEAQEKVAVQIALQIAGAVHGRGVAGSVNADIIGLAMRGELQPYLRLAENMGSLMAQLLQGALRSVSVSTRGELLRESGRVLCAALLKGLLGRLLEEPVNFINAPIVAAERGISVTAMPGEEHRMYANVVSVSYESDREKRSFAGTVFGVNDVRLIEIDGFHFEVKPEGILLVYSNVDRPGMLAAVGGVLAEAGINIGGLALGRSGPGGEALTVVNVDSDIPEPVLRRISSIAGIFAVKLAHIG